MTIDSNQKSKTVENLNNLKCPKNLTRNKFYELIYKTNNLLSKNEKDHLIIYHSVKRFGVFQAFQVCDEDSDNIRIGYIAENNTFYDLVREDRNSKFSSVEKTAILTLKPDSNKFQEHFSSFKNRIGVNNTYETSCYAIAPLQSLASMMPFIKKVFNYSVTDPDPTTDSSFLDRIKLVLYSLYCKDNENEEMAKIEILIFIRDIYRQDGFHFLTKMTFILTSVQAR